MRVYANGTPYTLSESPVFEGGEGALHELKDQPTRLVKRYHSAPSAYRSAQIRAIMARAKKHLPTHGSAHHPYGPFALPLNVVYGDEAERRPVGCLIPYVTHAVPLYVLFNPHDRTRAFPTWTFRHQLNLVATLVDQLNTLHKAEIIVGDLSHSNLLVDQEGHPFWIDLDGAHVPAAAGFQPFRRQVFTSEYLPEIAADQALGLLDDRDTSTLQQFDWYALGVISYQLLFTGNLPFTFQPNAKRKARTQTEPFGAFETTLRSLFEQPSNRNYGAWMRVLEALSLQRCQDHRQHEYVAQDGPCPWCILERKHRVAWFGTLSPHMVGSALKVNLPSDVQELRPFIEQATERLERILKAIRALDDFLHLKPSALKALPNPRQWTNQRKTLSDRINKLLEDVQLDSDTVSWQHFLSITAMSELKVPGLGPKRQETLRQHGIHTLQDWMKRAEQHETGLGITLSNRISQALVHAHDMQLHRSNQTIKMLLKLRLSRILSDMEMLEKEVKDLIFKVQTSEADT